MLLNNTLLAKMINIKHEISLFYSFSRKPTLRIAKIEGIAYITYFTLKCKNLYRIGSRLIFVKFFCRVWWIHEHPDTRRQWEKPLVPWLLGGFVWVRHWPQIRVQRNSATKSALKYRIQTRSRNGVKFQWSHSVIQFWIWRDSWEISQTGWWSWRGWRNWKTTEQTQEKETLQSTIKVSSLAGKSLYMEQLIASPRRPTPCRVFYIYYIPVGPET